MNIFRKRNKLDYWSAAFELRQRIPELKKLDNEIIIDYLRGSNLEFYKIEKKKTPFYIRLTLPFAIIFVILAFIFSPINFIITGHWNYGHNDKIINWLSALHFA